MTRPRPFRAPVKTVSVMSMNSRVEGPENNVKLASSCVAISLNGRGSQTW